MGLTVIQRLVATFAKTATGLLMTRAKQTGHVHKGRICYLKIANLSPHAPLPPPHLRTGASGLCWKRHCAPASNPLLLVWERCSAGGRVAIPSTAVTYICIGGLAWLCDGYPLGHINGWRVAGGGWRVPDLNSNTPRPAPLSCVSLVE